MDKKELMRKTKAELVDVIQEAGIEIKKDTMLDDIRNREDLALDAIRDVIETTEEVTGRRLEFNIGVNRTRSTFDDDGFGTNLKKKVRFQPGCSLRDMVQEMVAKAQSVQYTFGTRTVFTQWVKGRIKEEWSC